MFHSMSAKCHAFTGRGNLAMITHISQLSEELRKLYTRGRQISTPLHIGVISIFVRKKKDVKLISFAFIYLTHI